MPYFKHPKQRKGFIEWDENRASYVDPRGYFWLPDEKEEWAYEKGFQPIGHSIPPLGPEDFGDVNIENLSKLEMSGYLALLGVDMTGVYTKQEHRKRLKQVLDEGWNR